MRGTTPDKRQRWQQRAATQKAIVPDSFEVTPHSATIVCGRCKRTFRRNLTPFVNEPTFVCPSARCRARNWLPVTFKLS